MKLKIVETSLNLRIESGHTGMEYVLSKDIANKQLALQADIYCNVEFMECDNVQYLNAFEAAGYNIYVAVDDVQHRGVLYAVRKEFDVEEISGMQDPHMFHIRISKGEEYIDVLTLRILVAGGDDADYMDRKEQWDRVMAYVDGLEDVTHLVLTGDWNHGVIEEAYTDKQARRFYNYQMIVKALRDRNIELNEMEGTSYRGYMKIDHIANGEGINILEAAYRDEFPGEYPIIGVPDHKLLVATLEHK